MAVKVKHHKGAWWVFIDHQGKRKAKRIGASKRAAETVAEKIQAKIALGQFEIREEKHLTPTLTVYTEQWLRTYAAVHCKPATAEEYAVTYQLHLSPTLGTTRLSDITREDVKRILAQKLEKRSRARVKSILALLRAILNSAIEDRHITANPAARFGRFLPKAPPGNNIHPLTKEELRLLLATLQEHWPAYYPFFLTLARTGIRLGEALALKWEDIDYHGGFIEVRRNLRKNRIGTPKSHKRRRVDMSRQLAETLATLYEARKEEAWRREWTALPEWVFCSRTGQPLNASDMLHQVLRPACVRAGLRRIRIHDLRHTFASLLIQQGESLAYVKDQLGHHSIQIMVDVYSHLVPGSNRQAVDKLDDPPATTIRNLSATGTGEAIAHPVVSPEKDTGVTVLQERDTSNQKIACPVPSAAS